MGVEKNDNLLIVEGFVLRIGGLIVGDPFYQIIVIGAVVLLGDVQRILILVPAIFFLFPNNIFVVLQKLARLVFCRRVRLVLVILIALVPILGPGLRPVGYNLRNIHYTAVSLGLATDDGGHHALWKIVGLGNLIWQDLLRVV